MSKKILIVDDEKDIVKVLSARLMEHNYEIDAAFSGTEALAKIEKEKPDLIIMDIMMPDMDGIEVVNELKKNHNTKNIPIIFLSALITNVEEDASGLSADYLIFAKPYDIKKLIKSIDETFDEKEKLG